MGALQMEIMIIAFKPKYNTNNTFILFLISTERKRINFQFHKPYTNFKPYE